MDKKFRHFYLYAKGHYKETDIIEDLKKIAGVSGQQKAIIDATGGVIKQKAEQE